MMKIWLIRHPRVVAPEGTCYGHTDVGCGTAHTQSVAERLADVLPQKLPIYTSTLQRTQLLANALHTLRPDLDLRGADSRLNEMHFGAWEMQSWDAIPRSAFDAWMANFAHHAFGGAESVHQMLERVQQALHAHRTEYHPENQNAIGWICHAGTIRAVQYLLQHGNTTPATAKDWPQDAPAMGEWTTVEVPDSF